MFLVVVIFLLVLHVIHRDSCSVNSANVGMPVEWVNSRVFLLPPSVPLPETWALVTIFIFLNSSTEADANGKTEVYIVCSQWGLGEWI